MPNASPPTTVLIEGWRGINHSFALLSQYQSLELLDMPGLALFHRDLPFAFAHWNRSTNHSGFSAADTARLDALADPGETPIDCVFRVGSPFRAPAADDQRRTVTFMITEFGLSQTSFEAASVKAASFEVPGPASAASVDGFTSGDNCIVTSSRWSRDRIVQYGFDAAKVAIIPLGVDTREFYPLSPTERAASRQALGLREDETVFLNVGAAIWNKGIDLLLTAFARLRAEGGKARLILKDQRDVYGIPVEQAIASIVGSCPQIRDPEILAAITLIPGNVTRDQLRLLHGAADAYVSPYRAEGFNLPVLEAIACATPVIVTAGGATDDFCSNELGIRIPGGFCDQSAAGPGCFIEPDPEALLAAMRGYTDGERPDAARYETARAEVLERFTWKRAATELAGLMRAGSAAPASWRAPGPVLQSDLLELIGLLRPRAMESMGKVRIGNDYDGGYVLPACALDCDGVLSIGVGGDVSFDLALAERGARVMQFDHTVAALPAEHPLFTFHRLGWGERSQGDLLDFADIHARFSTLGAVRPMLKFDIEGFEYDVLPGTDPAMLRQYEVITCEIHDLSRLIDPAFHARARRALEVLTRDHAPVHLHANNYRGTAILAGIPIPDVLEITLLRRDLETLARPCEDSVPGPLDRPNHPGLPDLCMTPW